MVWWMLLAIAAFAIGFIVGNIEKPKDTAGKLYIDVSASENPELYLELYANPSEIEWSKHALFDVHLVK